ncbi:MAG: hypothetical protein FWC95_00630 [Defluviitaleaceae bacterium]|nr:hypothetical protein [Defluviitaleaceae bacterium]
MKKSDKNTADTNIGDNQNTNTEYVRLCDNIKIAFNEAWLEAEKTMKEHKLSASATKLLYSDFLPLIFRRWYFSTFLENTVLTPANLILSLNREFGLPEHRTLRLVSYKYNVENGENGGKSFAADFKNVGFGIDDHPLISDMRHFMHSVDPAFDAETPEKWHLPDLSLGGLEYRLFLHNILSHLKLVVPMPSLSGQVNMVVSEWERFFDVPNVVVLEKVINAVLDECVSAISEFLPISKVYKQKLTSYLKNPVPTDQIFAEVFSDTGVDIMSFMADSSKSMDMGFGKDEDGDMDMEMRMGLMSGAYFFGIILDRKFITPLAYYCRVIHPLYIIPYNVSEEIDGIISFLEAYSKNPDNFTDAADLCDEMSMHVFAPCTAYTFTDIGIEVLNVMHRDDMGVLLPESQSIKPVLAELPAFLANMPKEERKKDDVVVDALVLKVNEQGVSAWQELFVEADTTLSDLYAAFCFMYDVIPGEDFCFYKGDDIVPFQTFSSNPHKNKSTGNIISMRKSGEKRDFPLLTKLADVFMGEPHGQLLFVTGIDGDDELRVDIELLNVTKENADKLPRVEWHD